MPAEPGKQIRLGGNGGGDVHPLHRASRAARQLAGRGREQDDRLAKTLHELAGDNTDHPTGPGWVRQDESSRLAQRGVLLDLGQCGAEDLVGEQFTAGIERFHLERQKASARLVRSGEELHHGIGVRQATEGVQAWGEDIADMLFGKPGGVEIGKLHHDLQPKARRVAQDLQAALEQVARLAGQHRQVGDDAQGDQVEEAGALLLPSGAGVERFNELICHADAGQACERVPGRQKLGVDQGKGRGQFWGQVMMVGDEYGEPALGGVLQGGVGADAGIAGEQDARAGDALLLQHLLQGFQVDAVQFYRAHRDMVDHTPAQAAQGGDEHGGSGLPVHVEIAPDTDGLFLAQRLLQALDGRLHAGQLEG